MRGRFKRLIGVDPDPAILTNKDLDEAHVNDGVTLPFPNNSFDAVYSDWTLEHVARPKPFLREIERVLKPGSSFWARTTNRRHYVTVISAHTPQWLHRLVANRVRAMADGAHEPWPTRYRMNTEARLHRLGSSAGFSSIEFHSLEPEPAYLM